MVSPQENEVSYLSAFEDLITYTEELADGFGQLNLLRAEARQREVVEALRDGLEASRQARQSANW